MLSLKINLKSIKPLVGSNTIEENEISWDPQSDFDIQNSFIPLYTFTLSDMIPGSYDLLVGKNRLTLGLQSEDTALTLVAGDFGLIPDIVQSNYERDKDGETFQLGFYTNNSTGVGRVYCRIRCVTSGKIIYNMEFAGPNPENFGVSIYAIGYANIFFRVIYF